jgi:hypothetical protein
MILLGDTGFALCYWSELGRLTREQALQLLRRSQSDVWAQAALRTVVEKRTPPTALPRLNEDQVLEAVADLIASGELILIRTGDHAIGRTGDTVLGKGAQSAPAPPPPRQAAQTAAPPPAQDPKVFPPDTDPVAQAAALQAAAHQGAPFCEQ